MKATVTFDRISRNHNVPPLLCEFRDADELAERVWDYAKPRCMSRDIEVVVELSDQGCMTGAGTIFAGFHVAGNFTVKGDRL